MNNMKLEIGKLYNVSRPIISIPIYSKKYEIGL